MAKGDDPPPAKRARGAGGEDDDAAPPARGAGAGAGEANGGGAPAAGGAGRARAAGAGPGVGGGDAAADADQRFALPALPMGEGAAGGGGSKGKGRERGGGGGADAARPSRTQLAELLSGLADDDAGLLGVGGDDEEAEGDDLGSEIQAAVQKMVDARAAKLRRRQQQQLEQLRAGVVAQARRGAAGLRCRGLAPCGQRRASSSAPAYCSAPRPKEPSARPAAPAPPDPSRPRAQAQQLGAAMQRDAAETSAALAALVKGLRDNLDAKMRRMQELTARFEKARRLLGGRGRGGGPPRLLTAGSRAPAGHGHLSVPTAPPCCAARSWRPRGMTTTTPTPPASTTSRSRRASGPPPPRRARSGPTPRAQR
jgi:hypothetical protein